MVSPCRRTILRAWKCAGWFMSVESVRDGRSEDFGAMREEIAAALHPAVVVPGYDEIAHAETEQIVASVEAAFRQAAADPRQMVLVGEVDRQASGFLILDCSEHVPEVRWIVMLPGHVGTGLAHRLMAEALERVGGEHPVGLVVTVYNERAIRFFRRFGFVRTEGGASAGRVLRMRRPAGLRKAG